MKPWFRVYNDILNDEKLLDLSLDNQAIFFKLLAVSNQINSGGILPKPEVISKIIGVRIDKVRSAIKAMTGVGLIDEDSATQQLTLHGWSRRQYESDDANARQKARRERLLSRDKPRSLSRDKTVTRVHATDTDSDTDTEAENTPPTPQGAEGRGRTGSPTTRIVGPDGSTDVPTACSDADRDRLLKLASVYFDPTSQTDQAVRAVRAWAVTHEPEWIEAILAEFAGSGKRITEALGASIMRRWAQEGGIPQHRRKRPVSDPGSGDVISIDRAAAIAPAAFQRPQTDHQRKMAALRAVAYAPLTEEELNGHGGGVGFEGDGATRGTAGITRRA